MSIVSKMDGFLSLNVVLYVFAFAYSESINGNIDMIENEITFETSDSIIIEATTKNCRTQVLLPPLLILD